MRVNVEGGKYTICQDDQGKVFIERFGEPWITDPEAARVWIAVAFELYALRQIVAHVVQLDAATEKGLDLHGFLGGLHQVMDLMDGYTAWRQNLRDPGTI